MNLNICNKEYSLDKKIDILLDVLVYLQENINPSLGFKYNCRSGVCGSCAVRVNGVEKLACCSKINEGDVVEPLKSLPIIKDLIVDSSNIENHLKKVDIKLYKNQSISQKDIENIDIESNCILCNSCYSSCPVYDYNKDFIGPFALTRAYKYFIDAKDKDNIQKLEVLQQGGVWDCTLCSACSMVCPQSIDIKGDIQKLQNLSIQNGFTNPYMQSFDGGFDSGFGSGDFGFNPNGF